MTIGKRLKLIRGSASQANTAEMFKIPQTTWSNYENNRNKPDFDFIDTICSTFSVNTDWLLFGRGPMRQGETAPTALHSALMPQPVPENPLAAQENAGALSTKLEAELELERHERHELTAQVRHMMTEMRQTTTENRQLTAEIRALTSENRQLWKENGELREKCARLEAHQYQRTSCDGGEAVDSA